MKGETLTAVAGIAVQLLTFSLSLLAVLCGLYGARQAAAAAAAAGRWQADAAIDAAQRQADAEHQAALRAARWQAYEAFLSASDRLELVVRRLPGMDTQRREEALAAAAAQARAACAALELLGPGDIADAAAPLRDLCLRMELFGLDRAVVWQAADALWLKTCRGNVEFCEDSRHSAALKAWMMLGDWPQ